MDLPKKKKFAKVLGYGAGIYGAGLIALVGIGVIVSQVRTDIPETQQEGFTQFSGNLSNQVYSGDLAPDHAPREGSESAPVQIVEFSDFQCPYCKAAFPTIRRIVQDYQNEVELVYRHFPIDLIHPLASDLAHASMCAHEQNAFWPMHDKLFQLQDSLQLEDLDAIAQSIGLDSRKFRRCQDSRIYDDVIEQDLADGLSLGARGTPTWFVNGQRIEGVLPYEIWEQIIQDALAS